MMEKRDLYAEVTTKVIAQLEAGVAPWIKPWTNGATDASLPYNYLTKRAYRGVNVLLLWAAAYPNNAWLTYRQAQQLGAHVRKGERGTTIVFYKPFKVRDTNANGEKVERTIPLLRAFTVFNIAQIENLPEVAAPAPVKANFAAAAAAMAQAHIVHSGNAAHYVPWHDYIEMPTLDKFRSESDYYSVGLHELTHWTGHAKRCAREFGKKFGDETYAREELVAEMGAAFLCARFGIEGKLQHAEYLKNWIDVLKSDKRAILTAASAAQKAVDFITQGAESCGDEEDEDAPALARAA